ncbi:decarboxylase [Anabaena sp. AL09]|jgi:diaminopimelate decarboxylase|uniref:diaminopimelate decarboxylase family protein n=1 Tax=Anabaena sp. AL09 TaxID=1710891 RepID=UPI000800D1B2|nr:decarboxylase [Anabaena sp. AL09]OBQ13183.1 MAG: decarboxylase [Anabaena sp. AL09]
MVMEKVTAIPNLELELAQELLQVYGSPLYVYNGDILRQTISYITKAISYPHTQFHFASVTNSNIALLKIFKNAGWGLHANTPGDIYLGLNAGFYAGDIVYSGSNLNREEMEQIINWGVTTLNLDSISQLRLCCEVFLFRVKTQRNTTEKLNIGLRLNVSEDSRIGVSSADFDEAVSIASAAGLKISGLHFYRGTGTNATTAFTDVIDAVLAIAQKLPDWQYLDFGGGFGYPYHHDHVAFNWQLFGNQLTNKISKIGRNINLMIEPGRSTIAGCATLLVKVVSVKWQGEKQIIGVDSTIANIAVISVHGGYREIITLKNSTSEKYLTDVCGNTTYSRDYLGKNCQLPALKIDDIIAILDVGAYGYAMSSHFSHRPKPAEVLLENGRHHLIRKREDYSILLNNQII